MKAGIALLEVLEQDGIYEYLDSLGQQLEDGLNKLIQNTISLLQSIEFMVH